MALNLKGRSVLSLIDYTEEEICYLINLAHQVKREKLSGQIHQRFLSKSLAMIFEKRSTRTRCATETAFGEEGGHPVFLSMADIQLGGKETIDDTARVLGRMFDGIMFRGFKQETVQILADYSGVPVYNALTDDFHPTQALADIMTIEEALGTIKNVKICYIGVGDNNVTNSLMVICAKLGINLTIISPKKLFPKQELVNKCKKIAEEKGVVLTFTDDPEEGIKDMDVVYTDVWVSMGEEAKSQERLALLQPYRVTKELMAKTGKDSIFLHCLPAVKGNEVTAEVMEGPRSKVWDQAENRKHTIKAMMLATM